MNEHPRLADHIAKRVANRVNKYGPTEQPRSDCSPETVQCVYQGIDIGNPSLDRRISDELVEYGFKGRGEF